MLLSEESALAILSAAHSAWSRGDVDGVLRWYADNAVYSCNGGGPEGTPLILHGRDQMRAFLAPVAEVAESMSVIERYAFADNVLRTMCRCFIRHRMSGLTLTGTYRQVATFSGANIVKLEEFHDAARMAAFWRLVQQTVEQAAEG